MKINDLTNKKFGKLTAIERFTKNGRSYWKCICDCGNEKIARTDYLKNGKTISCGCFKRIGNFKDLTGKRFTRLIAISSYQKEGRTYWVCECDCGKITDVRSDALISGRTQSCGCLNYENAIVHLVEGRFERRVEGVDAQQLEQKLSARNKSGHTGVFYNEYKKSWFAFIGLRGQTLSVRCKDKKEAIEVRQELKEIYHDPYLEKYIEKEDVNNE